MKVYVPVAGRNITEVTAAILKGGYVPTPIMIPSGDDAGYWTAMHKWWEIGESFVVVEHDIVVRRDTIAELKDCDEPWCAWPVDYLGGPYHGLGCMKFRAELMREVPGAIDRVGEFESTDHPRRHWCAIDARLQAVLRSFNFDMHKHVGPALTHLDHDGEHSRHGCR
jgi:hypothetical protein